MKTDVTTSINDGDGNQQWVKRQGGLSPLCAIYSFGSHLQNKLNCQDEILTATAEKQTSCSAPASSQTTEHFLPIYLAQLWSWTSQNNKKKKFPSGWLIRPDGEFYWCRFFFFSILINVGTLWTWRGFSISLWRFLSDPAPYMEHHFKY